MSKKKQDPQDRKRQDEQDKLYPAHLAACDPADPALFLTFKSWFYNGFRFFFLLLVLLTTGCGKYYLSVQQQWIDVNYLASTQVNTPDPLRENPPVGQMLIIDWKVPRKMVKDKPQLLLDLVFWDYTTQTIQIPIAYPMNYTTYELLNDEYEKKGGILTYKASIVNQEGKLYRECKHQLWVNLIRIEE